MHERASPPPDSSPPYPQRPLLTPTRLGQEAVSTLTDGAESLTSVASPSPSPSPVVVSTTEAIPTVNALAQTLMDELPARHAPLHIHFGAGRLGLGLLVPSIAGESRRVARRLTN